MKKINVAFLCAGAFALVLGICMFAVNPAIGADKEYQIVYAHTGTDQNTTYWVAEEFKRRVAEYSNGQVKVEIHPAGSMGSDLKLIEMVKLGTLDVAITSNANYSTLGRAFLPFDLPYICIGRYNWYRVMTGPIREEMNKRVDKDGFKLLMCFPVGAERDLMLTKRSLKTPADVKGMKMRVAASPINFKVMKEWGFNPVTIPWSETYTSLMQGIAEGVYTTPMWAYISKMHEVVKYVVETGGISLWHVAVMNKERFDSFPKDIQKAIDRAAKEADLTGHIQDQYWNDFGKRKMIEAGIKFYKPSTKELKQWVSAAKTLWGPLIKKFNIDKAFVDRIQAAQITLDKY